MNGRRALAGLSAFLISLPATAWYLTHPHGTVPAWVQAAAALSLGLVTAGTLQARTARHRMRRRGPP